MWGKEVLKRSILNFLFGKFRNVIVYLIWYKNRKRKGLIYSDKYWYRYEWSSNGMRILLGRG